MHGILVFIRFIASLSINCPYNLLYTPFIVPLIFTDIFPFCEYSESLMSSIRLNLYGTSFVVLFASTLINKYYYGW